MDLKLRAKTIFKNLWESTRENLYDYNFMNMIPKAAAAAKSYQLCPTLCDPMDCSPLGSSVRWISRQEYQSGLPLPCPDTKSTGNKGRKELCVSKEMMKKVRRQPPE